MPFLVKLSVIFMITRCLLACNQRRPSSGPQIKFERVQNAPFDSAVAYSNPAERHGIEKDTPESHTLIGWQDFEAQHPLGRFTAVSRSHDSLLVNNDQPHQTPSTLSGSDGPPPSRETDQAEHARFWGAQEVSVLESTRASATYVLTDLVISSRRQCTTDYKTRRRRSSGEV